MVANARFKQYNVKYLLKVAKALLSAEFIDVFMIAEENDIINHRDWGLSRSKLDQIVYAHFYHKKMLPHLEIQLINSQKLRVGK